MFGGKCPTKFGRGKCPGVIYPGVNVQGGINVQG